MKNRYTRLLLLVSLLLWNVTSMAQDKRFTWGVSSASLGRAWPGSPTAEELLNDDQRTLVLDRFYRMGGEDISVTPTECRVAWNTGGLLVAFRCTEKNMSHPAVNHSANWHAVQDLVPDEQNTFFPDKVDLFIRLADVTYQFIVTMDGLHFGNKVKKGAGASPVNDFKAMVSRASDEWTVLLEIPWETIGGRPEEGFEMAPLRTRWRNSEVSCPVAIDFTNRPAPDTYMEVYFDKRPRAHIEKGTLIRLPSGRLLWQRPARLVYPGNKIIGELWKMQKSLTEPTGRDNLEERIRLTQVWTDLLFLEGFSFRNASGSLIRDNMSPSGIRQAVNNAFREGGISEDPVTAFKLLDNYMRQLDTVSRRWFADGSPGNIRRSEWAVLAELENVELEEDVVVMSGRAGNAALELRLSFPESGGARLQAFDEGYFKPARLLRPEISETADGYLVTASGSKILVTARPFGILFYDSQGEVVKRIGEQDIAFRFDPAGTILATDLRSRLSPDELIYGFGEQNDRFDQNGNVLTLWGVDSWNSITVGLNNQTYKPIPVFHSTAGYSVFINSSYRLRADVGKSNPAEFRLSQHGPVFDYYFWTCPPGEALRSYTVITGKPLLPPRWAFEPWMGGAGKRWRRGPLKDAVAEQKGVVEHFRKLDIPHSAMYIEGTSDNPAIYAWLQPYGIKPLSWQYSSISKEKQQALLPERSLDELPLLRDTNGSVLGDIDYVDFSHPAAKLLSERWWTLRLDLGVAGSMVDFGDRVPEEALFSDGRSGAEMHNFYAYDYHRTYSEVFRERRGDDYLLFGRAAAPGDQQWAAHFAGDHRCNFVGLRAAVTGSLNFSASGFSTWGSDLGGFKGWPDPAVYMRWTQFACFSPLMRAHGTQAREPWEFGEPAVENYKYYAWVRENLLDYIYATAVKAHQTGVPFMRSMPVAFPNEKWSLTDQYMFGQDFLVAPVTTEANSRVVQFPPGRWVSLWDGSVASGGTMKQVPAPLDRIPVYLKQGAVVPLRLNDELRLGESMTGNEVNALLVTPPVTQRETSFSGNGVAGNISVKLSADGFSIHLNGLLKTRYLIIYDAEVQEVEANGVTLPELTEAETKGGLLGWYRDEAGRRTIVRLPAGLQRKIEINAVTKSEPQT